MAYAYFKTDKDLSKKLKDEAIKIKDHGDGNFTWQVILGKRPERSFWDMFYNDKTGLDKLGWIDESEVDADIKDADGKVIHRHAGSKRTSIKKPVA